LAVWVETFSLDCRNCSEDEKVERGCEKDSPIPDKWQIDEDVFQRCPLRLITRESLEWKEAFNFFKANFLPNPGTWQEQPVKFLEAMKFIDYEVQKVNEYLLKKNKR